MTEAADQHVKVGRSYTRARRFPWVVGKIQGWTIPLGPYTATQLGVLIGGLYLLVKTFDLWRGLGAAALVPIAAPFAATWAVRHAHIDGRTPLRALAGFAALLTEPQCGRINGRLARDTRPTRLTGGFRLSSLPEPEPAVQPAAQAHEPARAETRPGTAGRPAARRPAAPARDGVRHATRPAPTALQALLAASAGKED